MNLPNIINAPCVSTAPTPPNANCSDPAFALANPGICGSSTSLRVKPGVLITCALGSVQFNAFTVVNGLETLVTSGVIWSVSDPTVALIGATSGNATGIAVGEVTVTAIFEGITGTASLTVLAAPGSGSGTQPLIPTMTSDMTPSGQSSASSTFGGGDGSFLAFDGNQNTFWGQAGNGPSWLQYKFAAPTLATIISLFGDYSAWTLLASNDGVNFVTLTTGPTSVGAPNGTNVVTFLNTTPYEYYRVNFQSNSAVATMQLFTAAAGCCQGLQTATVVVVDKSFSMSLAFGGGYTTKQAFADAVASAYINQTNASKDQVALVEFDSSPTIDSQLTTDITDTANQAASIVNTSNLTGIGLAIQAAAGILAGSIASTKIILLISDGEDKDTNPANAPLPIAAAFQAAGGIIMCIGVRAHDAGFNLLNAIATGGFFINSYPAVATQALQQIYALKGYLCSGNCAPNGNQYVNQPALNYMTLENWNQTGILSLIGDGQPPLLDVLPGNGLYLGIESATLTSKNTFTFIAGKTYDINVTAAGNQMMPSAAAAFTIQIGNFSQTVAIPLFTQGFQSYSFTFTPQVTQTVPIVITALAPQNSTSTYLLLINSVELDDVTDLTQMFFDNFEGENLQYTPPACGGGVKVEPDVPIVTDIVSGVQVQNPPAPTVVDVFFGVPPISNPGAPTVSGVSNLVALIPNMTSDTAPAGYVASGSTGANAWSPFGGLGDTYENGFFWVIKLPSAKVATKFSFSVGSFALPVVLSGSNDGSTWTTLASAGASPTTFSNSTPYLYYRFQPSFGGFSTSVAAFQIYGNSPGNDMLPGDVYDYAISYENSYGETLLSSTAGITIPPGDSSALITMPGGADPSVTNILLWRQEFVGAGPARFYLMATLSPGTASYTDGQSHADFQSVLNASPTPPVSNTTGIACSGDMSPADTYLYAISFQTATGETALSPTTTHIVGANCCGVGVHIPTRPAAVTHVRLWRQETISSVTRFYLLNTLSPLIATIFDKASHADFQASANTSIFPPVSNTTSTGGGGNMVQGDVYSYEISYLTAAGQSGACDAVTHTNGANANSLLINFPWTPPTVNTIQLWRKETVGISAPQFYLLGQFPAGTATFTDALSHAQFQAQLSATPTAPATWRSQGSYAPTYFPYYGYNCYGYGCLSAPPGPIQPDPNALPDIEANFVPPTTYTGEATVTSQCPAGTVQNGVTTIVPVMTSPTTPIGTVTNCNGPGAIVVGFEPWRAFGAGPGWRSNTPNDCLIYQFTAPQFITSFAITGDSINNNGLIAVTLQGSNDGIHWTPLIVPQSVILSTGAIQNFQVTTPGSYSFYQLGITPAAGQGGVSACVLWQMFLPCPTCTGFTVTKTATSTVSQNAANQAATQAATAAAQALLASTGCIPVYTSTKNYTAFCPMGQYDGNGGNGFTASATYQSYISQADADANALAQAQSNAAAGLNCKQSNNQTQISVNKNSSATPYPSIFYYGGAVPSISRVQVVLNNMKGGPASSWRAVLVSPGGLAVGLIQLVSSPAFIFQSANVTIDSQSVNLFPASANVPSGTYAATGVGDTAPLPCPQVSFPASFAALIGTNPTGSWSLWVWQNGAISTNPIQGTIDGWSLIIS